MARRMLRARAMSQPSKSHISCRLRFPGSATEVAYAAIRGGISLSDLKRDIERECIARALSETGGNITRAASLLGMKRPRLSQLVKQYGFGAEPQAPGSGTVCTADADAETRMKGKLAGPVSMGPQAAPNPGLLRRPVRSRWALACSGVAAVMLLGALAGCVAESADVEDEAPPVSTALGFQPDVPKVPAQVVPSKQGSGPSGDTTTLPPQDPSDDGDNSDPEPSPWIPGDIPQETHTE